MYSDPLIPFFQQFSSSTLDSFFIAVTELGSEDFYTLLFVAVYWLYDKRIGTRLGLVFLISMSVNFIVKTVLAMPRPPADEFRVLYEESGEGFGFPSGHAQGNATVWGYLILRRPRLLLIVAGFLIVGLVSVSRLYLGLHYSHDVFGGLALGIGVLLLFSLAEDIVRQREFPPLLLILLSLTPLLILPFYRFPDDVKLFGFFIGIAVGSVLERHLIRFDTRADWLRLSLRFAVGAPLLVALQITSGSLIPPDDWQLGRYALIGLAITAVIPWLFTLVRLAANEPPKETVRRSAGKQALDV